MKESPLLAFWNPYSFCGTPFLADVQSAVLYPFNQLFFRLLSVERAFGWSTVVHLILAGLFCYGWLRAVGLSPFSALLGALSFQLGGWTIAWLHLPNFLNTVVWGLALLWIEKAPFARSWKTLGSSLSFGMMLLAGHLQIAFYTTLAVFLYLFLATLFEGTRPVLSFRSWSALMGSPLLSFLCGFLLASVLLQPAYELSLISPRQPVATWESFRSFLRLSYPWHQLVRLWIPNFMGNPSRGLYWGPGEYSELCSGLPAPAWGLFFCGLLSWKRESRIRAPLITLAFGLLLALGTLLNALFYFLLPGFSRFGSPSRAVVIFSLMVPPIVASGFEALSQRPSLRQIFPALLATLLFPLLGIVLAVRFLPSGIPLILLLAPCLQYLLFAPLGFLSLLFRRSTEILSCILILLAFLGDAGLNWYDYNPIGPEKDLRRIPALIRYLQRHLDNGRVLAYNPHWPLREVPRSILPPNTALIYRLPDVQGYNSLYSKEYKETLSRWQGKDVSPLTNGNLIMPTGLTSPILRRTAVHFLLIPPDYPPLPPSLGFKEVFRGPEGSIYKVAGSPPIAEFIPQGGGRSFPLKVVRQKGFNQAILKGFRGPGKVLFRETYLPGWRAYALTEKGAQRALVIRRYDTLFRQVEVREGDKEVLFEYEPPGWRRGLGLSLLGLLLTLILALGLRERRRSSRFALPSPNS